MIKRFSWQPWTGVNPKTQIKVRNKEFERNIKTVIFLISVVSLSKTIYYYYF